MSDIREKLLGEWKTIKLKLRSLKNELALERSWITMWINSDGNEEDKNILLGGKIVRTLARKGLFRSNEKKIEFKINLDFVSYKEWISGSFDFEKRDWVREILLESIRGYYKDQYQKLLDA